MTGGEYLLGLILIITGLAISELVISLHGVLLDRRKVKWDWLALLAVAYVFLMIVNSWGLSFQTWNQEGVNPPLWQFLELLGQIIPLYLAARASLPDSVPAGGVDLADHYAWVSRYFWASIAITLVLYLGGNMYAEGAFLPVIRDRIGATLQLVLMLPLIASQRRSLHALLVPVIVAIFCFDHVAQPMFG